jgi:hypothetical protein
MLMRTQYYFLTSLPSVPALGEAPPIGLADFYDRTGDLPEVKQVVAAVLLEHDLLRRQSVLSGELEHSHPLILTVAQGGGEDPLPEYLQAEVSETTRTIGDDATWEAYFRHVADVAARTGCEFLRQWVGFEVSLRNALVAARAKALDLMVEEYYVAADLADAGADTEAILAAWSAAADPLSAMKALDRGRWDWLASHGGWFSFRIDEAAAYARGLVLLHRWQELTGE